MFRLSHDTPSLITILNYTTLKLVDRRSATGTLFDYHLKLHYSQTVNFTQIKQVKFDYHLKLHYSQTQLEGVLNGIQFDYHLKLHYSQTIAG